MNCDDIEAISPLWLSRELDAAQQLAVHSHLAGCPRCAAFLKEQAALDARIAHSLRDAAGEREPGAANVERLVLKRIAAERLRRRVFTLAAAAALAGALFVGYRGRASEPPPRIFVDAARDHRLEVVEHQPRRWRTEMPDIERLAGRFGLSGERALSMAPKGYWLLHARTCGLEGQPALHLVFTDGTRDVSVYVRKAAGPGQLRTAAVDGEQLASLYSAGYETVAVTPGNKDDCVQIVRRAASML